MAQPQPYLLPLRTLAIALLGILQRQGTLAVTSSPHLVFILQDDLGHYDVAFNGNTNNSAVTANITKLARDGIILKHHYTHWHCSPTRRSFLSGRLPVHHHEQLSGVATDDLDLRYTWISKKLKSAGYANFWFGKGHTGYMSMNHMPTRNGFDHFVGFLSGSQSYTSNDRWEDEHPLHTDAQFVNPPKNCGDGYRVYSPLMAHVQREKCAANQTSFHNLGFQCPGPSSMISSASSAADCCAACDTLGPYNCTHWTYMLASEHNGEALPQCTVWSGRGCSQIKHPGAVSGKPAEAPNPPPAPPGPDHCASSYSTTLYGELCLQAIAAHNASVPLFLYFPIQAVHTPYDKVPGWTGPTYEGMLWDSDVQIGAIMQLLNSKGMYDNTLVVYTADNGGTGSGINFPLRGEKHTNWEGGMRTAAFVSGGLIPASLRGTTNAINMHIVDWYPTFCYLAGVDGTDNPPVPPSPVDPADPGKNIYGDRSYPGVDGVNLWNMLTHPEAHNRSSAHPYLVLSKEVVVAGSHKLLVAQNYGWSHTSDNGWKQPDGTWVAPAKAYNCGYTDLPGGLNGSLPGLPGRTPCLFDLDADVGERTDIAGSSPEIVAELWGVLNHTVLTAFCKDISIPPDTRSGSGCLSSPKELLGNCDAACAGAYWKQQYGSSEGPICGVPGC
eukprot:m.45135 g.45135  ORF g.45135 m.45135 type:complete len:667 (+) comp15116_c0_seq3:133-2133(+)